MISAEELAQLRTDVEGTLPDTCTITRGDADPTFDPNTGTYTYDPDATLYSGPCRVVQLNHEEAQEVFGEANVGVVGYMATLPHDAAEVKKDDIFTVTDSEDPQLETASLEVHSVRVGSLHTARRIVLQEVRDAV